MNDIQENVLHPMNGFVGLLWVLSDFLAGVASFVLAALLFNFSDLLGTLAVILGCALMIVFFILWAGFKVVHPNEARVLTLFGKYYGTIRESGFYYVNPFCSSYSPLYNAAHAAVAQRTRELSAEGKATIIPVNVSKAISTKTGMGTFGSLVLGNTGAGFGAGFGSGVGSSLSHGMSPGYSGTFIAVARKKRWSGSIHEEPIVNRRPR